MPREVSDWLSGYLKYTHRSEPPLSYHTWVGMSVIAGALQRKVYLEWGFEKIYPNLYVVLVGPSGRARKGVSLSIGKDLLGEVPTVAVASEAVTREALIRRMKDAMSNFEDPADGRIKLHCSLTCFSEELSVFLGQNDIKFLASLTDWYDSKDNWTYETKGQGKDHLQGLCFNLLGATAPDWLQSMLPQEAVGGGFTSRVIFVVEERKGKTVAKHMLTPEERNLKAALARDLDRIHQLSGPFNFDAAGEAAYIQWYEQQDKLYQSGNLPIPDPRFSGYCERRATHLRKVMMVLSASRGEDRTITEIDFNRAVQVMESAEKKMDKTFGGLGKAKHSDVTEKVMSHIQGAGTCSRSELMRRFYRDVDGATLKIIEEVMLQMNVLDIRVDKDERFYTWIG